MLWFLFTVLSGFSILNALVTDLSPDSRVRDGMYNSLLILHFLSSFFCSFMTTPLITYDIICVCPAPTTAMNEINSSQRMKEAAYQRAEGDKVVKVKRAEAAAESMYLSGVGVSKERKAIMDGLK